MQAQLEALNISYEDHAKVIEDTITKHSMLAGVDDEALTDAFTRVVRVSGDVKSGLEGAALAADIAAGRNMDLSAAAELVAKVHAGKISMLSRYGIVLDKNATKTEALAALESKFAGQAEAAATGQAKLGVIWENLQEKLGAKLLPLFERFSEWLVANMPEIERIVGETFSKIGEVAGQVVEMLRPIFQIIIDSWPQIQPILELFGMMAVNLFQNMLAPMQVIVALLRGDWGAAWDAAKAPVERAMAILRKLKTDILDPLIAKFTELAGWVKAKIDDIVGFFTALPGRIFATLAGLVATALTPFQSAFTAARNWVDARIDDIVGFFTKLPGRIAATLASLAENALAPFRAAFEKAMRGVETALGWVETAIDKVKEGIKWLGNTAGSVLNAAVAPFKRIGQALADALGPLADMLDRVIGLARYLADLLSSITSSGTSALEKEARDRGTSLPGGATGAIVRRPTLALIGEAGPEALVPLNQTAGNSPLGRLGGGGPTIIVNVAGHVRTERDLIDAIHAGLLRKGRSNVALGLT